MSRPGLEPGLSNSEPSTLTDWTTEQSRGIGMPTVQLITYVKSSTLYSHTVIHPFFFWLDGLLLFCIIMGLRSVSSAIIMYEESGVWVAVVEGGGRGGEWSQHFHQSFMIIC